MAYDVVYNACYGGFSLSNEARDWLAERGLPEAVEARAKHDPKGPFADWGWHPSYSFPRHHPLLVECVKTLGERANGACAKLQIETVAGLYRIDKYDGRERVEEPQGVDWINAAVVL